jgi:hypothetical protein
MNQYKVEVAKQDQNRCVIYKRVFIFFWGEVGSFNSYGVEASIVEQAAAFIHSKKPYYFEA